MNLKAKPDEKQEGTVVFSLITRKGNKANAKGTFLFSLFSQLLIGNFKWNLNPKKAQILGSRMV